jgi:hypothetical protein
MLHLCKQTCFIWLVHTAHLNLLENELGFVDSRDHDILSRSDQGTFVSTITGDWVRGSLFHHPSRYIVINTHSFHLVNTVQAKGTSKGGPNVCPSEAGIFEDRQKEEGVVCRSTYIQATFWSGRLFTLVPAFFHAYPGAGRSGCPLVQFG